MSGEVVLWFGGHVYYFHNLAVFVVLVIGDDHRRTAASLFASDFPVCAFNVINFTAFHVFAPFMCESSAVSARPGSVPVCSCVCSARPSHLAYFLFSFQL